MEDHRKDSIILLNSLHDIKPQFYPQITVSRRLTSLRRIPTKKQIYSDFSTYNTLKSHNFDRVIHQKENTQKIGLENHLKNHYMFAPYIQDKTIIKYLIQNFIYRKVQNGEYIMNQGDQANFFFIVEKGRFLIQQNDKIIQQLGIGQGYGQVELYCNKILNSFLWIINKFHFKKIFNNKDQNEIMRNLNFIERIPLIRLLSNKKKQQLSNTIITQIYAKKSKILKQGNKLQAIYFFKSGKIIKTKQKKIIEKILPLQVFGEQKMFTKKKINLYTVEVQQQTEVLLIPRLISIKIFGDKIYNIIWYKYIKQIFIKNIINFQVNQKAIQQILYSFTAKKRNKDQIIVNEGNLCSQKLFIVLEGILINQSLSQVEQYKNYFFGVQSINNDKVVYKHTYSLKTEGLTIQINLQKIKQIINKTNQFKIFTFNKQKAKTVELNQLYWLKKLGYGKFGSVHLVTNTLKNQFYAIKCINIKYIQQNNLQKYVLLQKRVLQSLNHPFIYTFAKTFKDQLFIYILTQFINGIQMFDAIRQMGLLNTPESKFYLASLILCFQYLHNNNIIYRDLKPENIMINSDGYIKLIDMGTSKFIDKNQQRTFTIIGTPHYMATDVLSGKGYSKYCDIWSFGICFFQFMCGYLPFGENAEDPYQIYEEILNKQVDIPDYVQDKQAAKLILQILQKSADRRKWNSFTQLKTAEWFMRFDWNELIYKQMFAPYIIPDGKKINVQQLGLRDMKLKRLKQYMKEDVKQREMTRRTDSSFNLQDSF